MYRHTSPNNPISKPQYDEVSIIKRLQVPNTKVDVVLDTDTYNEVDDQFALAYMLKSEDKINVKGITAAPFSFKPGKSTTPGEGMEKSYLEIKNILGLLAREDLFPCVKKGSTEFLSSETEPVISDAAEMIVSLAEEHTEDQPLYVVSIGAITNVASALLLKPDIRNRIVIIWLGSHSYDWPDIYEYNLKQDISAARVVFNSCAPLVLLPCRGVVSAFSISKPELDYWFRGKNKLCDYLCDAVEEYAKTRLQYPTWSKPIWDVTAVAWLLGGFMHDRLDICPIPGYDFQWEFDKTRHPMRYVYYIERDKLMLDLITKLTQ